MKFKYKFYLISLLIIKIIFSKNMDQSDIRNKNELATFGAGCFWCVEAVFERIEGVISVESGYAGGNVKNPTYKQVCKGDTGHAEVIQIKYNSDIISYQKLLDVFWKSHDPTTLNRQGADVGTQYRSVIFYHSYEQKVIAQQSLQKTDKINLYSNPIVTEIAKLKEYYKAENYHQDYYRLNSNAPYCQFVIKPKIDKLFD